MSSTCYFHNLNSKAAIAYQEYNIMYFKNRKRICNTYRKTYSFKGQRILTV